MKDDPMLVDITEKRRGLLKYILFRYAIEQKESVWVLNFLKDHEVLRQFTFRRPLSAKDEGIILTQSHHLLFHFKDRIMTQPDVIFHLLNEIEGQYYFYVAFDEPKFAELEQYESIRRLIDERRIPENMQGLRETDRTRLTELLNSKIDIALLLHDKEDFVYYSSLIKRLKE
ncbi:YpiB family protein [Macrococcus equipercicus]|nr:YpiB family protein [Macrococcus equipercicus]